MSDQVGKDAFNAHMKNVYSKLESYEESLIKIFDRLDQMNVILAKNTVIVETHQERSTKLEKVVENTNNSYILISNQLAQFGKELESIEEEIEPIKKHVAKVTKLTNFIDSIPNVLKVVVLLVTLLSSSIGFFTVYKETKKAIVIETK